MKNTLFAFFALGLLVVGRSSTAEIVDRVVAVVANEVITLSDVKHYSAQRSANVRLGGMEASGSAQKDPLEALIREKLLNSEMQRLGIVITEEDINGAVQDVLTRNKVPLDVLKAELSRKGMSFEQYRKNLSDQIRQMKFLSQAIFPRIKLTEEEINRKTGPNPTEETRVKARIELLQARSSAELAKFLDEARAKTYVEIKK